MTTPIKAVAHACIKTADLAKITAFYCDTLGLEKLFRFTRKGEVVGFYLRASPGSFVEVFLDAQFDPARNNGNPHHLCLETSDIEAARQRLLDAGYAPREIKKGADLSWQFWIKDPDGMELEFQQYTPDSSQFTGQDVELNW